jgi:hypothetical protein
MAVKVATLAVCQWVDEGESVSLQECIAIDCAARGVHGRGFMLFWRPGHHSSASALPRLHRASRCHDWPCQAHDPCLGLYLGLPQRVRDMRPDAKHSHAMNTRGAPRRHGSQPHGQGRGTRGESLVGSLAVLLSCGLAVSLACCLPVFSCAARTPAPMRVGESKCPGPLICADCAPVTGIQLHVRSSSAIDTGL